MTATSRTCSGVRGRRNRAAPGARRRPGQLHRAAGRARPVVRAPPPFPLRVYAQLGRGAPIGVLRGARGCGGGRRGGPRAGRDIVPLLLISELRTIAGDSLWLSPHEGRDSFALHFTWRRRPAEVEAVVARSRLPWRPSAPGLTGARCSPPGPTRSLRSTARMTDFLALRERLDPDRKFVNDWLREKVLPAA